MYESSIHNIAFSSEKVANRWEIYTDQTPFTSEYSPKTVLNKYVGYFDVRGQQEIDFMEEILFWIMARKLKLKCLNDECFLQKNVQFSTSLH